MIRLDPPEPILSLLPSVPARWVLWLSVCLSVALGGLFHYLQINTFLPLEIATKLAILTPILLPTLIGSFVALYLNNEHFKEIEKSFATPKPKEPDLSKKTELQEQILKSLESESMSSWIAQNLKLNEQEIIKNLESLEGSGLVTCSRHNRPVSWYLSKSGRVYLYPST